MGVFWVTIILTTIANITITSQISNIEHKADKIRSQIESLANDGVTIYETSGKKALNKWYKRINKNYEIRAVLFHIIEDNTRQTREKLGKPIRKDKHDDDDDDDEKNERFLVSEKNVNEELDKLRKHSNFRRPPINTRVSVISPSGQHYIFKILPSPYLHKELRSSNEYRWLRLLVTLSIILLASLWLSRHVVKPVIVLKRASQKMATGQLSTRVSNHIGSRKDELGELSHSFDDMAEQLEKTITGQKQLLRDISHEIRTPLTRQRIAIDLVREQLDEKDNFTKDLLGKIESQNNKLNELIENLLTLNRLDEGSKQLSMEAVDLSPLLQELIDDAELEADAKNINIIFQETDTACVNGNRLLLARAFENIVGNALKYSPESSTVSIDIALNEKGVTVDIDDQGPGLSEEELKQVFTPFYRADNSRTQASGGYGLGLAIVKKVVDMHKGSIRLDSPEGRGLSVHVWLPLSGEANR